MLTTPWNAGGVAVIHLHGDGVEGLLREITAESSWPLARVRLVELGGVDRGLAVRLDTHTALLMPHGGVRLAARLLDRLVECGAEVASAEELAPRAAFPEAGDDDEAAMLVLLARAASDEAIDALLARPAGAQAILGHLAQSAGRGPAHERAAADPRRHLVYPPSVVVAGAANVGKSTLLNALAGRAVAVTHDAPGTTRDAVTTLVNLGGLVVRWSDTPGLRPFENVGAVERQAVESARSLLHGADMLIAVADIEHEWVTLPRPADLRVASRADLGRRDDADCLVSAVTGEGLETLVRRVRAHFGLSTASLRAP